MQFTVISTLAFAAQALAAVSFTTFPPKTVQVGQPVTLSFTADDANSPVRIVLRRGPSNDLKDVATLTDSAKGGSYTWTPSSDLSNGSDYALEIIQGSAFNYGTQFSISGGSASSSSSSSSAPSGYSSITTHVPIPLSTGGPAFNKTYGAGNATIVAPTGTRPYGSAVSAGSTGSPNNPSNGTFSSPTPSAPTSGSGSSGSGSSGSGSNGPAAGTTTGSSPASTTTAGTSNGATHVGSSLALILGAVAAFAFLN